MLQADAITAAAHRDHHRVARDLRQPLDTGLKNLAQRIVHGSRQAQLVQSRPQKVAFERCILHRHALLDQPLHDAVRRRRVQSEAAGNVNQAHAIQRVQCKQAKNVMRTTQHLGARRRSGWICYDRFHSPHYSIYRNYQ